MYSESEQDTGHPGRRQVKNWQRLSKVQKKYEPLPRRRACNQQAQAERENRKSMSRGGAFIEEALLTGSSLGMLRRTQERKKY